MKIEDSSSTVSQTVNPSFPRDSQEREVRYTVKNPLLYQPFDSLERIFTSFMNLSSDFARWIGCPNSAKIIEDFRFNVFKWFLAHCSPHTCSKSFWSNQPFWTKDGD